MVVRVRLGTPTFMLKITRKNIVDEISCISEIRKKFYKTILEQKYEKILKYAYNKKIKKST